MSCDSSLAKLLAWTSGYTMKDRCVQCIPVPATCDPGGRVEGMWTIGVVNPQVAGVSAPGVRCAWGGARVLLFTFLARR